MTAFLDKEAPLVRPTPLPPISAPNPSIVAAAPCGTCQHHGPPRASVCRGQCSPGEGLLCWAGELCA